MIRKLKRGTTGCLVTIDVYDAAADAPKGLAGLTHATSGLTCHYKRSVDSASTAVPLVGGVLGAHAPGKFMAVPNMPGVYEFGVPDAALASGTHVDIHFGGPANMWCPTLRIELDALDYQDPVRAGLASLPNAAPGAVGGALVSATAANQVTVNAGLVASRTEATAPALTFNLTGNVSGSVGSVAGPVQSVAGGVKLAPDGLDAISAADPGPASNMNTLPKMIVAIWRSFYRKSELDATSIKRFADNGSTVNTTQSYSDDGVTQKIGSAG